MNVLKRDHESAGSAWIEVPPEFIDEFFSPQAERRVGPRERRPELGLIICAVFVGLFWGSAALLVL